MSMSNYTTNCKKGEETYASYFEGTDNRTGEKIMIKKFRERSVGMKEATILNSLNSPNIFTVKEIIQTEESVSLILPYADLNLRTYIHRTKTLEPKLIQSYAFQLLCAITYLHEHNIIQCDISPESCYIDKAGWLKIINFELSVNIATEESHTLSPMVVRLFYRPLELLLGSTSYDYSVDVWSAGCVIALMLNGKELIFGSTEDEQIIETLKLFGTPNKDSYPGVTSLPGYRPDFPVFEKQDLKSVLRTDDLALVDLLSKLLEIDPSRRITARAALHHPYFDDLPKGIFEVFYPPEVSA